LLLLLLCLLLLSLFLRFDLQQLCLLLLLLRSLCLALPPPLFALRLRRFERGDFEIAQTHRFAHRTNRALAVAKEKWSESSPRKYGVKNMVRQWFQFLRRWRKMLHDTRREMCCEQSKDAW
jgi:hypothetical protein